MHPLLTRLRHRKLGQWSLAYLAGAWGALQVAGELRDTFAWPPVVVQVLTVLLGIGFFAVLVLAWYHGEKGQQRVSGPELALLGVLVLAAGLAVPLVAGGSRRSAGGADRASLAPPREVKSIAVLPFANTSGDPENEHFGDGLTDELISTLSRIRGLNVAARTSVFALKDRDLDVRAIGDTLGVGTVLEGSVRRSGSRLRVSAQLVDVRTGYQLWSESFDRELEDVLTVQEEISRAIVNAMQVRLASTEQRSLIPPHVGSTEAYTFYLKGSYFLNRITEDGLRRAVELLQQAIRLDPGYAPAYAKLAHAHIRQGIFFAPPREAFPLARTAALHALRIDPALSDAHVALAFIQTEYDWDWEAAERDFRRGLQLNPGYAGGHQWYQNLLRILGRFDEAVRHGRRAVELDPLSAGAVGDLAYTLFYARQFDQSARHFQEALQLDPASPILHMRLAMAYEQLGRHPEAVAAAERAVEIAGRRPTVLAALGRVYASAGRSEDARRIARELEQRSATEHVDDTYLAMLYTGLGRSDDAFAALERAFRERSANLVSLGVHPWHDTIRGDRRFARLLGRLAL